MNHKILNSNIKLENARVLLLPFGNERYHELKQIIFNDRIWKYMGMSMHTEMDFELYVKNTITDQKKEICYPFLIVDKQSNRIAGSTRFGNLNTTSEKCEIGWTWYGLDFQGTGLNKACKYELLKFGFETIGFRRIQFSADQENLRSQRAIEKLGAQQEGIFRNNYIAPSGESRNDVYYSIIKEDWATLKQTHFSEYIS